MSRSGDNPEAEVAAGSPAPGEPVFLVVGKLRRPHGVKGEMLMEVLTDFPERLKPGGTLYVEPAYETLVLRSLRPHKDGLLVAFEGCITPETAGEYRNRMVAVKTANRPPLAEGEYYHHQVIGLRVSTASGQTVGRVVEILTTGAHDVLVVRGETGPEILIPLVEPFLQEINLAEGEMIVSLIPGMLPGEES
jgi:16S rRNA processing protein RimM